jgi:hypothetical protein
VPLGVHIGFLLECYVAKSAVTLFHSQDDSTDVPYIPISTDT